MNNETTEKKEEKTEKRGAFKKPWVQSIIAFVLIFGALGGFIYWQTTKDAVSIDNSYLDAPVSNVSVTTPGVLNAIYVKENDSVTVGQAIALVGSETLYAKEAGIISGAPKVVGAYFTPGQTIASIIVNQQMRVVGSIDETKGLEKVSSGQRATFTVDAFPGKTYEGTVDEVSPVSNDTGVVFSISDKRPTKQFNVYVSFNVSNYPELKSGMSAKVYINTKI